MLHSFVDLCIYSLYVIKYCTIDIKAKIQHFLQVNVNARHCKHGVVIVSKVLFNTLQNAGNGTIFIVLFQR